MIPLFLLFKDGDRLMSKSNKEPNSRALARYMLDSDIINHNC